MLDIKYLDCGLRGEDTTWYNNTVMNLRNKFEQKKISVKKKKKKTRCNRIWIHDLYDTGEIICTDDFLLQVANTYAFLPREAVSYYLMSCSTCKQRIQRFNSILLKHGRPLSPVSDLVSVVSIATQRVKIFRVVPYPEPDVGLNKVLCCCHFE